jgi:hypothetical protein
MKMRNLSEVAFKQPGLQAAHDLSPICAIVRLYSSGNPKPFSAVRIWLFSIAFIAMSILASLIDS